MARVKSVQDLRAGLGDAANDYSDEELVSALAAATGMPLSKAAERFGYDTAKGPWSERASASIDNYQSSLYGLGEAVSGKSPVADFMGRRRRANEISANISSERAKAGGIPDDWRDIKGPVDAAKYVGGLAVDSGPYIAESVAGGLIGRGVGLAVRGGEALTQAEARRLALIGGTAASYPSSVGDILGNQRDQSGETNLGTAAALGIPYAALNSFGESRIAATLHGPRAGVAALDRMNGVRGGAARAGVTGLRLGVEEGLSETGQEVVNQAGRVSVDPNATMTSPDAQKRYLDSFIGGAALGGALGPVQGGWRRSEGYQAPSNSPMASPRANPAEPDRPVNMLKLGFDSGAGTYVVFPDGSVATNQEQQDQRRYGPQPADPEPLSPYDQAMGQSARGLSMPQQGLPYAPVNMLEAAGTEIVDPGPLRSPAGNEIEFDQQYAAPEGMNVVDRANLQSTEPEPQLAQPAEGGDTEQPPLKPNAPVDETGIQRLEQTKQTTQQAHEAIGRAQEAGMTSEKQQTGFWRAEELNSQGKLTDSKMIQVVALLAQSMYGKATKIMDEAAVGVGHDDLQAKFKAIDKSTQEADKAAADMAAADAEYEQLKKDPETKLPKLAKVRAKRAAAQAKHAAAIDHINQLKGASVTSSESNAVVAPMPVRDVSAGTIAAPSAAPAPATGASKVKERASQANRLQRYQALLACLTRK